MEKFGLDKGLVVLPMTFQAIIYCHRCEGRYVDHQHSREQAQRIGSPLTIDPEAWREYLTRIGWTEGGTVCLSCSKEPAP